MAAGERDSHTREVFSDRRGFLKGSAALAAVFSPAFGALRCRKPPGQVTRISTSWDRNPDTPAGGNVRLHAHLDARS